MHQRSTDSRGDSFTRNRAEKSHNVRTARPTAEPAGGSYLPFMRQQREDLSGNALASFVREGFAEAVIVLDQSGRLVERNRAAAGERYASVLGRFERAGEDPELGAFLRELEAEGHARRELTLANGGTTVLPLSIEGESHEGRFVVVLRDLSERRALENELKQLRHFESLGLLTANVLHDFNNLMTPMLVLSSTLASELQASTSAAALAADLESIATRSALLFRDVVATARPRENALEIVVVNTVLSSLRRWIERAAGSRIRVSFALAEPAAKVLIDRPGLEHALLNLIANARNAMPDGGSLHISTAVEVAAGTHVLIRVRDDGTGMTDEVRARAFEAFFTTREDTGGTGLGLASVKRFVGASGGSVELESTPGRGTTVTLRLPEVRESAAVRADLPAREP